MGAALGATGVVAAGFITVTSVAATEGGGCDGALRRNWFTGGARGTARNELGGAAGTSVAPTPARISSSSESASTAVGNGAPPSTVFRFTPPAPAAAFLANMFASRWRSFLSSFVGLAFLGSGDLPPFLRFFPSPAAASASSSSSLAPACAVVQSSSSPRSTYLCNDERVRSGGGWMDGGQWWVKIALKVRFIGVGRSRARSSISDRDSCWHTKNSRVELLRSVEI